MTIQTSRIDNTEGAGDLFAVDRVRLSVPDRRAEGVRNVPATLDIFDSHFPRLAVLPGVIILGCLTRVAAQLLTEMTGRAGWELTLAERIRYRHFVQPGDALELQVEVDGQQGAKAWCSGKAYVSERPVTTVRRLELTIEEAGS